jgi:hypothetical protein
MSVRIFKNSPDQNILFTLLENNCMITNNQYIFNMISYKKALYNNEVDTFIHNIRPFYYLSKRVYLDRKMNYNHFMTILRQLCNYYSIAYEKKIIYDNGDYDIVYFIQK